MTTPVPALVGQPVARSEDARFLTGRGKYVDDLSRDGLLHAAILRTSVAHGRIRALETEAAKAMPGVRAIFTAVDLGASVPRIPLRLVRLPELEPYLQPVIAHDTVRYVGEPLAVVIAETAGQAEDALAAIESDIEPLPVVADHAAAAGGTTLLFAESERNRALHYTVSQGDVEAAFRAADYRRREIFRAHRHTAVPMETRGILAEWDAAAGKLVVSGATKVAFVNRRILAAMLDLPESNVDLIEVDVGGGFGVRGEFYPEDFLIPFAARRLGAAVKWIEDRREHLLAANHSREVDCEVEIACKRDGTILGLRARVLGDMGAYIRTNGAIVPARAAQFLPGPYRIPAVGLEVAAFVTNKAPLGTYRGPGRFEANFFRERLLDMVARDLAIDPIDLRRRNLITEAELPYPTGRLAPFEDETDFDSGDYPAAFERALAEIQWTQRKPLQGQLVDGRYHGLAVVPFVECSGSGRENVRLAVEADGSVTVYAGSSVLGQGLETTLAQVAADALRLPFERIRVLHGSTTYVHEGFGTFASRSMVVGGSAVLDGCNNLVAAIRAAAAARLGLPNEEIVIENGEVRAGARRASLAEFAGIEAEGTYFVKLKTYSYGAHACHVAVDPRTAAVDILEYVAIEDIGRVINPLIVHGQAIGGVVQGLGGALLEHLRYDESGQLLNASLADYLMPLATDFPSVRAVTLELKPSQLNPLGAKGAGEGGVVAVAAAVANAVAAALAPLGVELRELPLSPPRLWRLIEDARQRSAA